MLGIIFYSIVFFSVCNSKNPSSSLTKCDSRAPDFNMCLSLAVEDALRKLVDPIPELDLPSFKPLSLTKEEIPRDNSTNFSIKEELNSFALCNITTAKVLKFDFNFKEKTIKTIFAMEEFYVIFYNLTLTGKAYDEFFNFTLHAIAKHKNAIFDISAVFEELEKENSRFINIIEAKLLWTFEANEFTSESENKEASEHYDRMVQKHLKEVSEIIKEGYDELFASLFIHYANRVFSKVSIFEMFNL